MLYFVIESQSTIHKSNKSEPVANWRKVRICFVW